MPLYKPSPDHLTNPWSVYDTPPSVPTPGTKPRFHSITALASPPVAYLELTFPAVSFVALLQTLIIILVTPTTKNMQTTQQARSNPEKKQDKPQQLTSRRKTDAPLAVGSRRHPASAYKNLMEEHKIADNGILRGRRSKYSSKTDADVFRTTMNAGVMHQPVNSTQMITAWDAMLAAKEHPGKYAVPIVAGMNVVPFQTIAAKTSNTFASADFFG